MAWVFNPFTGTFDFTNTGGGGITSLTANTTPTTGFTAGQYMFSDGSVLKAGTFGTGVSTALGNAVNAASGLITFATFAPASGKSLTLNNTLTLAGTDGTTMTFPSTSATIARTDAGNTFTGNQVVSSGSFGLSGNILSAAWTTNGIRYANVAATLTDTSSSGTVAAAYTDLFGGNTIEAINSTTFTNYYTTWINAGATGTNVAITNNWALGLGGNLKLGVDASGSNQAGTATIIAGSRGTGNVAGGTISFQVGSAGSSGTAQNALTTLLSIDPSNYVMVGPTARSNTFALSFGLGTSYYTRIFNTVDWAIDIDINPTPGGANNGSYPGFRFDVVDSFIAWSGAGAARDVRLYRDTSDVLALRRTTSGATVYPQEFRVYGAFTSTTNYQRTCVRTLRQSSGALSGASFTSTISIPAYAIAIGVTTRVTTAITGATSYSVGDGTTADLWGNNIGITLNSQSQTSDFTAVGSTGAAATARTVTLTANGSNFTGGVVEICVYYLLTEAD